MTTQAMLHQAEQAGLKVRVQAGQVRLAANESASNRENLQRVASSTMGEGVGQGRTEFEPPGANVDDLATLIQATADFWCYDADDLAIIHDFATSDPEALRRSLLADPLRPFYGSTTA